MPDPILGGGGQTHIMASHDFSRHPYVLVDNNKALRGHIRWAPGTSYLANALSHA